MRGYLRFVRATTKVWRIPGTKLKFPNYLTRWSCRASVIVSVYFMAQVPGSLFPPEDESRISISVELPPGSTLEQTDRTTEAMRAAIKDIDGVERSL